MFAKTMIKDSTIIKARTTTEAVSDMTPFLSLLSSVLSVTKKKKKNEEDEKNCCQHGISLCFPHRSLPLTNYVTSRLKDFFEAVSCKSKCFI